MIPIYYCMLACHTKVKRVVEASIQDKLAKIMVLATGEGYVCTRSRQESKRIRKMNLYHLSFIEIFFIVR